jgi:DNA-binding NarL/FixJ family response regulator
MPDVGTGPEGPSSRGRRGGARHPPRLFAVAPTPPTAVLLQAISAALTTRGLVVEPLGAPGPTGQLPVRLRSGDVMLVMDDLPDAAALAGLCALVCGSPARVLVLTAHPADTSWTAVLDAGAASVRPSSAGLDEVAQVLTVLADGGDPAEAPSSDEAGQVQARDPASPAAAVVDRMAGLTATDRLLLALVCRGMSPEQAAPHLEAPLEEVVARHDALLRRLGVGTDAEAVRALDLVLGTES